MQFCMNLMLIILTESMRRAIKIKSVDTQKKKKIEFVEQRLGCLTCWLVRGEKVKNLNFSPHKDNNEIV